LKKNSLGTLDWRFANPHQKRHPSGRLWGTRFCSVDVLEAGFCFFHSGEDLYQGVDPGMAHDGFYAVAYAGQQERAAFGFGGDEVVGDEAEAGGVDVGNGGEIEDQDLGLEGAELSLQRKHGGEGERSGEGQNGGSVLRSR
jgi:hypothetical protein